MRGQRYVHTVRPSRAGRGGPTRLAQSLHTGCQTSRNSRGASSAVRTGPGGGAGARRERGRTVELRSQNATRRPAGARRADLRNGDARLRYVER
eukprot:525587-Prymnesium_polylepis.1